MADESVHPRVDFTELLRQAVQTPGKVHQAYSAFHGYSIGNQMLALCQCLERGIQPGPMTTFPGWKAKGRHVKKGAKALWLWQPITVTRDADKPDDDPQTFTRFIFRNRWFVFSQTEGQEVPAPTIQTWDRSKALATLNVQEIPFSLTNGNVQGRSEEHTSELQSHSDLVCRLLLEKKKSRHVAASRRPLVIGDARVHPLGDNTPAVGN